METTQAEIFLNLFLCAHSLCKSLQTNDMHTQRQWVVKFHKELEEAAFIIPSGDWSLKGQDHIGVFPLL